VLDAAEDIVNAAGASVLEDLENERRRGRGWRRFMPRRRR
jgi:hypothetical protein